MLRTRRDPEEKMRRVKNIFKPLMVSKWPNHLRLLYFEVPFGELQYMKIYLELCTTLTKMNCGSNFQAQFEFRNRYFRSYEPVAVSLSVP